MDLRKYINNKENINIYNLTENEEIISKYNLENYPVSNNMEIINPNLFSDKQLFIFILKPNKLNKIFFTMINMLNNTLLLIINNNDYKNNDTHYKKLLVSYGYKYQKVNDNKINVFIYDISEYKDNPDWLNSENWANPDLWEK